MDSSTTASVSPDAVRASLKQCMDPEVPISIVDMGLVYGIDHPRMPGRGDLSRDG